MSHTLLERPHTPQRTASHKSRTAPASHRNHRNPATPPLQPGPNTGALALIAAAALLNSIFPVLIPPFHLHQTTLLYIALWKAGTPRSNIAANFPPLFSLAWLAAADLTQVGIISNVSHIG